MTEMKCNPEDFASDLPTQTLHVYYEDEELGMSVGVWTTSPMQEAFGPYPGDEFIWLLEGGFKMVDGDEKVLDTYQEGECVYFRNAAPVSWVQEETPPQVLHHVPESRSRGARRRSAEGAVKAVDASITPEQMTVLEATDPFIIEGEKPTQRDYNYFTNDTEDMFVGLWDSTPFESEMAPFPCHEFVRLLEGRSSSPKRTAPFRRLRRRMTSSSFRRAPSAAGRPPDYVKKYYAMVSPAESLKARCPPDREVRVVSCEWSFQNRRRLARIHLTWIRPQEGKKMMIRGRCECAAIQYEAGGEPTDFSHCHCSQCRRLQGAPYVSFVGVDESQIDWKRGREELKVYASSTKNDRYFCPHCGAHIMVISTKSPASRI